MPANQHLQWTEIRDFSPGLWTNGDTWLMPANAAQTMQDCHPMPAGGLRAFYRRQILGASTSPNVTGLAPTTEVYFGVFAHPAGGINPTSERYLMAWDTVTNVPTLYYSTGTDWTAIKTFATTSATPTIKQSFFVTYLSGTTRRVVFNLNVGSADDGIWIVTGGGTPTQMTVTGATAESGPLVVHQSRIVVADGSQVRFTDPGTETFQSGNFIDVEPSGLRPNTILMASYEPSDLLIGKEAGPLVLVQGDLSDPVVRSMDDSITLVAGGRPGAAPGGLAVAAHRDGIYLTNAGGTAQKISKQLSPNNFGLPAVFGDYTPSWFGDLLYAEGFLFTPSGIYDMTTNSWFTSGTGPGNAHSAMFVYDRSAS